MELSRSRSCAIQGRLSRASSGRTGTTAGEAMETTTHLDVATRQPQCRSRHQHISFKTSIVDRSLTSFVMVRLPSSEMTEIGLSLLAAQSRSNPREPPGQKASFIDRKRTQQHEGRATAGAAATGTGAAASGCTMDAPQPLTLSTRLCSPCFSKGVKVSRPSPLGRQRSPSNASAITKRAEDQRSRLSISIG